MSRTVNRQRVAPERPPQAPTDRSQEQKQPRQAQSQRPPQAQSQRPPQAQTQRPPQAQSDGVHSTTVPETRSQPQRPPQLPQLTDAKVGWESPRTASPLRPCLEGSHSGVKGATQITPGGQNGADETRRRGHVTVLRQAGLREVVVHPNRSVSMVLFGRPPPDFKSRLVAVLQVVMMPVWLVPTVYGLARADLPLWLSIVAMLAGLADNIMTSLLLNVDVLAQLCRCFEVWYLLAQVLCFTIAMSDMLSWDGRIICLAVLPVYMSVSVLSDSSPMEIRSRAVPSWIFGLLAWLFSAAGLYFDWFAVIPRDVELFGFTLNTTRIALSTLSALIPFTARNLVTAVCFPKRCAVLRATVEFTSVPQPAATGKPVDTVETSVRPAHETA